MEEVQNCRDRIKQLEDDLLFRLSNSQVCPGPYQAIIKAMPFLSGKLGAITITIKIEIVVCSDCHLDLSFGTLGFALRHHAMGPNP